MNIEKPKNFGKFFTKKSDDSFYASSFRRSSAAMIDIWIVLFLRTAVMQMLGWLWLNREVSQFILEFKDHFGTETVKNVPEHIDFIIHHRVFVYALIFYAIVIIVGALYHALLNSSAWQGTIGKRLMKIIIVKSDQSKISFLRAMSHYFLSILPFVFVIYLMSFQMKNNLTFFQAITASEMNVFFGILFIIWVQIHVFTKRKTTAYDMICDTILINKKMEKKFPWSL